MLTVAQRRKRLQFARKHEHLSAQDWKNYIFSDESTKYLFHVPNRQDDTVWGSQSENVPDVNCVKSSAKVMIWGQWFVQLAYCSNEKDCGFKLLYRTYT